MLCPWWDRTSSNYIFYVMLGTEIISITPDHVKEIVHRRRRRRLRNNNHTNHIQHNLNFMVTVCDVQKRTSYFFGQQKKL